MLGANQSYSHTFTKSGNFDYRDAFNTNRRGSITVRAGVTLKASAPLVAYGGSVTLSGVTSSGAAGETVTLDAMECGKTTFARVASVRSVAKERGAGQADDEHRLPLELEERDECPARRKGRTGDLAQATRGRPLSGSVTAAQSFAGKYVVLQRYVRTRRAWKTVKRVTLRTARPAPRRR